MVSPGPGIIWRKIRRRACGAGLGGLYQPSIYVRPLGILWGRLADSAISDHVGLPLVGRGAYTSCEVILRQQAYYQFCHMSAVELNVWYRQQSGALAEELGEFLENLSKPRQNTSLSLDRNPSIVGILNLTPDSFSDGGDYMQVCDSVRRARALIECGASVVDVGGESTRPGANPISSLVEQERVLPVVEALVAEGMSVSIDTYHPDTMKAASALGVEVINDVSGFTAYPDSVKVAATTGKALVLVHSSPLNTEQGVEFEGEVVIEIYETLLERIKVMEKLGISRKNIVVDPGLGFKKNSESNFKVLRWLSIFHGLGCPIMVGGSRKFGRLRKGEAPKNRMAGSVAVSLYAAQQGIQLLRVHDVAETRQALGVWKAMV